MICGDVVSLPLLVVAFLTAWCWRGDGRARGRCCWSSTRYGDTCCWSSTRYGDGGEHERQEEVECHSFFIFFGLGEAGEPGEGPGEHGVPGF